MQTNEIKEKLLALRDKKYCEFSKRLTPTKDEIIGVRLPQIKNMAKDILKNENYIKYLENPEFVFFEEKMLYGFVLTKSDLEREKKYEFLNEFINHIDNWAINDSIAMSLKIKKDDEEFYFEKIKEWLTQGTWQKRFGIVILLSKYTTEKYIDRVFELYKNIKSEEYYVNIAIAWAMSIAIIKFYDKAMLLITNKSFCRWIHNKILQKSIESFRITKETKEYLKTQKIK